MKSSRQPTVRIPDVSAPLSAISTSVVNSSVSACHQSQRMPSRNPKSPNRVVTNAFAASAGPLMIGTSRPSAIELPGLVDPAVPEPDQQIRPEAHALPEHVHDQEVVREDQTEHRGR